MAHLENANILLDSVEEINSAVMTIPLTCVEAEKSFSIAGLYCDVLMLNQ